MISKSTANLLLAIRQNVQNQQTAVPACAPKTHTTHMNVHLCGYVGWDVILSVTYDQTDKLGNGCDPKCNIGPNR